MAWEKGQSGNPGGKPLGPKNTLKVRLVNALLDDFAESGAEAIQRVRTDNPAKYLELICALVPKDVNVKQEVDVTHRVVSVPETDSFIAEVIGGRADRALPESLSH
jgi:hypothetical protein